jgi:anti-anti-sigma factor
MHTKHQGLPTDSSAAGHATPRRARDTSSHPSRPPVESPHARARSTSEDDAAVAARQTIVPGQLAVRWERQDDTWIMWLSGTLDQATVTLLDRELDARAIGMMRLVIDVTGLEFIDSPGLDALVGIRWRVSRRADRLSFRHGLRVDQRPVELTRGVRLRSRRAARAAGVSDENFYFALAMACVNVDHSWSGDRPEAA